jgi:hypothetical protein
MPASRSLATPAVWSHHDTAAARHDLLDIAERLLKRSSGGASTMTGTASSISAIGPCHLAGGIASAWMWRSPSALGHPRASGNAVPRDKDVARLGDLGCDLRSRSSWFSTDGISVRPRPARSEVADRAACPSQGHRETG